MKHVVLISSLLCAGAAFGSTGNVYLEQASDDAAVGQYKDVLQLLDVAEQQKGNSLADRLAIQRLRAIAHAVSGDRGKARAAFVRLLALSPDVELPPSTDRRALELFREVQAGFRSSTPAIWSLSEEEGIDEMRLVKLVIDDPYEKVAAVSIVKRGTNEEKARMWRFRFLDGKQTFLGNLPIEAAPVDCALELRRPDGNPAEVVRANYTWQSPMAEGVGIAPPAAPVTTEAAVAKAAAPADEAAEIELPMSTRVLWASGLAVGAAGVFGFAVALVPLALGTAAWAGYWTMVFVASNDPARASAMGANQRNAGLLGMSFYALLFPALFVAGLSVVIFAAGAGLVGGGLLFLPK